MASTYTKQELLKKERIAYSKIHGMDKLLSAKPSERDGLVVAYPDAHFALQIANNLFGHDREQCAIHQTAYFAILNAKIASSSCSCSGFFFVTTLNVLISKSFVSFS